MVPTAVGDLLRTALHDVPVPDNAADAERALVDVLAVSVPKMLQANAGDDAKAAVAAVLAADGRVATDDLPEDRLPLRTAARARSRAGGRYRWSRR
ncbi:hypothetical protein GCM10027610_026450 [Dactylosporangium cerinum]